MRLSKMISAVDVHACGEPGRVIVGGVLDVPGKTMFEKKTYLETPLMIVTDTGITRRLAGDTAGSARVFRH